MKHMCRDEYYEYLIKDQDGSMPAMLYSSHVAISISLLYPLDLKYEENIYKIVSFHIVHDSNYTCLTSACLKSQVQRLAPTKYSCC